MPDLHTSAVSHEEHAHEHSPVQLRWLLIRNIFVTIAALLFLSSMLPESTIGHLEHTLRAIAYFFGALAYGSEIVALTEAFRTRPPLREMFMPYVFSILYLLLGYSYLVH